MAKDYSVVRNCVKHRPEKSPSSRFQPTKLFALSLKTNSFHNLSFLPFFFPFWLFTFIFISSPCASHWNLEFFWFTQTSFFVHQKNSRFQCSALRFTDKTYSSQPKLQEKCLKTHVVQWICFPGNAKYFVGWKRLEKNHLQSHLILKQKFASIARSVSFSHAHFIIISSISINWDEMSAAQPHTVKWGVRGSLPFAYKK